MAKWIAWYVVIFVIVLATFVFFYERGEKRADAEHLGSIIGLAALWPVTVPIVAAIAAGLFAAYLMRGKKKDR